LKVKHFQTMGEIAVNQNSTIVLPVPLDLFKPFLEEGNDGFSSGGHGYGRRDNSPNRGAKKRGRARGATKRPWKTSRAKGPAGRFLEMPNQEANPKVEIHRGAGSKHED
jgi:hypothetical protein